MNYKENKNLCFHVIAIFSNENRTYHGLFMTINGYTKDMRNTLHFMTMNGYTKDMRNTVQRLQYFDLKALVQQHVFYVKV